MHDWYIAVIGLGKLVIGKTSDTPLTEPIITNICGTMPLGQNVLTSTLPVVRCYKGWSHRVISRVLCPGG